MAMAVVFVAVCSVLAFPTVSAPSSSYPACGKNDFKVWFPQVFVPCDGTLLRALGEVTNATTKTDRCQIRPPRLPYASDA